jgi:hypothetical protein
MDNQKIDMLLFKFYILSSCTIQKHCDYDNPYTISLKY